MRSRYGRDAGSWKEVYVEQSNRHGLDNRRRLWYYFMGEEEKRRRALYLSARDERDWNDRMQIQCLHQTIKDKNLVEKD